jgi:hypothetical protein
VQLILEPNPESYGFPRCLSRGPERRGPERLLREPTKIDEGSLKRLASAVVQSIAVP